MGALAQCRGTICLGARNLSRCRILIADRCACPGVTTITNLSWEQELSKKCDKQLTHIVRVISRLLLLYLESHALMITNSFCRGVSNAGTNPESAGRFARNQIAGIINRADLDHGLHKPAPARTWLYH